MGNKITNYEEYFSDLCSKNELFKAMDDFCGSQYCSKCPFGGWGQFIGLPELGSCIAFERWLDLEVGDSIGRRKTLLSA